MLARNPSKRACIVATGFGVSASIALVIGLCQSSAMDVLALFGAVAASSGTAGPLRDLLVKQATPPCAPGRFYGVVCSGIDVGMLLGPLLFGLPMDARAYRGVWLAVMLAPRRADRPPRSRSNGGSWSRLALPRRGMNPD